MLPTISCTTMSARDRTGKMPCALILKIPKFIAYIMMILLSPFYYKLWYNGDGHSRSTYVLNLHPDPLSRMSGSEALKLPTGI